MPLDDAIPEALRRNVRTLRERRGLSHAALAARSGLSKGILIKIEQGRSNPSLSTLLRVATALDVSLPELLEDAPPAAVRVLGPDDALALWSGPSGGEGRMLAGSGGPSSLQVWDWRMRAGEEYVAQAQPHGAIEIIHVLQGTLTLRVGDERVDVRADHTVMFHPDRPHGYANRGRGALRMTISNWESSGRSLAGKREVTDDA